MFLADTLTLDAPKRTKEGFLAVRAKAARAGVYDYKGCEVDPEGKHFTADQVVKVYRSPEEVFDRDSVHSFLLKPITDDHPSVPVTADNWKQHARGVNAGAMRDGDFLAFDLVLMDAAAIKAVDSGKKQLSNGYQSEIVIGGGVAPDGTRYDAEQKNIRGNHVALVDKGRAGPECRIGDVAICDAAPDDLAGRLLGEGQTYRLTDDDGNFLGERRMTSSSHAGAPRQEGRDLMATKTITFDGMPIEATDQAEAAIRKLESEVKNLNDAKSKAETDLATAVTDKANLEAKVTTLVKQIEDAKVTPAQLRDAAKAYQAVVDKAKALGVKVTDEMDEVAIMKAAVAAKVGDAGKDWNDEQVAASFASLALSKDAKIDPVRAVIANGSVQIGDTASIRDAARASRYAPAS